jgi:hypothetical protein
MSRKAEWENVLSRLRTVHKRDDRSLSRLEILVDALESGSAVVEQIPRVSVGWLRYTKLGCKGAVNLSLDPEGDYQVSMQDESFNIHRSRCVKLDEVLEELDLALHELEGATVLEPLPPLEELKARLEQHLSLLTLEYPKELDPKPGDPADDALSEIFAGLAE